MGNRPQVTVLGSLNMDISVTVPRLPEPGATVLGSAARFTPGGKGANQAVAAARLGATVRMAGCVGDDDFGRRLLAALREENVDAGNVRTITGVPTGLAMISVDPAGENLITVAPGANHEVGAGEVTAAASSPGDVLVICAEIPVPAIRAALARASRSGARCILNLAPAPQAPPEAAAIVADGVDWLVVNETEAAAVLGRKVEGLTGCGPGRRRAGSRGCTARRGHRGRARRRPGRRPEGRPADHRGVRCRGGRHRRAGDTFVGALAVALAAGVPPAEAVRAAAAAGATAATRHGAQAAMPRPADIRAVTGLTWPVG